MRNHTLAILWVCILVIQGYAQTEDTMLSMGRRARPNAPVREQQNVGLHPAPNRWALWCQVGLGSSNAVAQESYIPDELFSLTSSLHVIHGCKAFAFGADYQGTECHDVGSTWGAVGWAGRSRGLDLTLLSGLSLNEKSYNTESEYGTITSIQSLGMLFKLELLVHLPQVLGLGCEFTYNYCNEVAFTSLTFILAFGKF